MSELRFPEPTRSSPFHCFHAHTPFVMDIESKVAPAGEKDAQSIVTAESYLDASDRDKVQRKLRQRHVQMCVTIFFLFCLLVLTLEKDCRKGARVLMPLTILIQHHFTDRRNPRYWSFPCKAF